MADSEWTDADVQRVRDIENEVWATTQFHGIPRCVAYPYSGTCCGQYDEEGNLTGICPPLHEE